MSRYAIPRAHPSDPRTNPSLAGTENVIANAIDNLDYRVAVVEGRPPTPGPPGPPGSPILIGSVPSVDQLPPTGNTVGDTWLVGTVLYTWDGVQWVQGADIGGMTEAEADSLYVNVTGDQMTGALTLRNASGQGQLVLRPGDNPTTSGWIDFVSPDGTTRAYIGQADTNSLVFHGGPINSFYFDKPIALYGTLYVIGQPVAIYGSGPTICGFIALDRSDGSNRAIIGNSGDAGKVILSDAAGLGWSLTNDVDVGRNLQCYYLVVTNNGISCTGQILVKTDPTATAQQRFVDSRDASGTSRSFTVGYDSMATPPVATFQGTVDNTKFTFKNVTAGTAAVTIDGPLTAKGHAPTVVKSTTPVAADYGLATIPVGAVWIQSP